MYHTGRSKEELYIESKRVFNTVEPYSHKIQETNGISPSSTTPRKPPRSKHDPSSNLIRPPSQEATQRVLIGTYMIGGQQKANNEISIMSPPNQKSWAIGINGTYGYTSLEVSAVEYFVLILSSSKRNW